MNWFVENFKKFDQKVAIVFRGKNYSYVELYNEVKKIRKELVLDINEGEVVSIISDYSFESIALLVALYQNKNIIVPITTTIQSEIRDRIAESYTDKIIKIVEGGYCLEKNSSIGKNKMIQNIQESSNSGLILFSSGSTGKPKAMIHNFDNLVNHYKDKKIKSINMILFLMFDHIGGLNTLLNILSMGATMVIPENRNADDICKLLQDYKITVLPSSPTFLNLILMSKAHEKYNLSSLRMITYGTEVMPESLLNRLREAFPKVKFLQTFGTSETGIANTSSKSSNSTYMRINDPNLEYKIVDSELWLRSKTQVMGYLNSPMDSFTEDGWFKTGDLVEIIDADYIKIIGRNKEVINVGGEKLLPNEVESLILKIPGIEDCMIYGENNLITGQTVVCDVVVASLEHKEVKKIIRLFCKGKLEGYKVPTKVNVVDKINFSDRFKKIRRK
jgi:acyl-CoA synthetase (AMP-forming)/AMP-acid ligase II